jgi:hypothetical protein
VPDTSPTRRSLLVLVAAATCLLMALASPSAAQSEDPAGSDETVVTTSTLPTDNRNLGEMIPRPFTGMEPQDPGDPGGWLQVSLFFLLVLAVVGISTGVWWTSRRARQRRDAAGFDPVELAKRRGEGVRRARSTSSSEQS